MAIQPQRGRGRTIERPIELRRFKYKGEPDIMACTALELAEDTGLTQHEIDALHKLRINEYIRINRCDIIRVK